MSTSKRFDELSDFISRQMRMSHIYQPVMLIELLKQGGKASTETIAKAILVHDPSQIDYYKEITNNMVGRVLTRNHGITTREDDHYSLKGYSDLSLQEVNKLIVQCDAKLADYIERRGKKLWQHRIQAGPYISGTLRYEVLKRAKFRCELCGISADEKALEVDHILPRIWGGLNDLENFQALCYSCNACKRDRDDTDFRKVAESYEARQPGCPFCKGEKATPARENRLDYAMNDAFPVTAMHMLIIPRRHVESYFDLYQPELNAIHSLLNEIRKNITDADHNVSGFNVGINDGSSAGQTIFHCHLHVIPRRKGDLENPRGGIRGIVPAKRLY